MWRRLFLLIPMAVMSAALVPVPSRADDTSPVAIELARTAGGTYYVDASIHGYGNLELLVDTGSSVLVITDEILEALLASSSARYSHDLGGVMADGSRRVVPVYRLSAIRLGPGCWIHDVDAAVFADGSRPILGMNVLARLAPFTFSANPPELALSRCQQQAAAPDLATGQTLAPGIVSRAPAMPASPQHASP